MVVPLLALAVPSVLAGFWGISASYARQFQPGTAEQASGVIRQILEPFAHAPVAALGGLAAALVGIGGAILLYGRAVQDPLPERLGALGRWMRDRFYFDEAYAALNAWTQESLARLADAVDRWVIAGLLVRGAHGTTELAGRLLRLTQTGNLQIHAILFAAGVVLMLLLMIVR
jgi:NADH:ubiquinone oxidoreductase subunit 5 (subunit L)/multisubunit Na+/H+ antiporter MnhA subunit